MSYYKDKTGTLHYLSAEDVARGGERFLPPGCSTISDQEAQALMQPETSAADGIKAQISDLEASITARRFREALLGDESAIAFINGVDAQIAALREQLP